MQAAGLDLSALASQYTRAIPLTMGLCEKVIHNCTPSAHVSRFAVATFRS